jgi:hypothetical protein
MKWVGGFPGFAGLLRWKERLGRIGADYERKRRRWRKRNGHGRVK